MSDTEKKISQDQEMPEELSNEDLENVVGGTFIIPPKPISPLTATQTVDINASTAPKII